MRVTPKHLPVFVAGNYGHMFYRIAGLREAACAFMH